MTEIKKNYNEAMDELLINLGDNVIAPHLPIADVIGQFLFIIEKNKKLRACCPFHAGDDQYSLRINTKEQLFTCTQCNAQGNGIDFLERIHGEQRSESVRYILTDKKIRPMINKSYTEQLESKEKEKCMIIHRLLSTLYHSYLLGPDGKEALDYLIHVRSMSLETIKEFQIGFAPKKWTYGLDFLLGQGYSRDELVKAGVVKLKKAENGEHPDFYYDYFRERIMFPIHNEAGKVVAFGGRRMDDEKPKYLNSPETCIFSKKDILFNHHRVIHMTSSNKINEIVLYEGYMDVIMAWQAGFQNGLASMGTSITEKQSKYIKHLNKPTIVCYDGDDAGKNATSKAINYLSHEDVQIRVATLPEDMDPDEYIKCYGPEGFKSELTQKSLSTVEFKIHSLKILESTTDPIQFKLKIDQCKNIFSIIEDDSDQKKYESIFANHFNITVEQLQKIIA
jgi:DNA primase